MMKIDLANGTVSATIKGEGRPLVMFHSLLSDCRSFDTVIDSLAARFRVVVPELPGFGDSSPVTDGIAGIADRMAELVHYVAGDQKPILLGNGFGSFVALQMLIRHPGIASKLIVAAGGAMFSEPGRQAFHNMATAVKAKGLEGIADIAMRRLFAPEFQAANPAIMADRRAAFLRTPLAVFEMASEELAVMDIRTQIALLDIPLLVVVGEQDEATPPAMARELAAIVPGSRLIELAGCAHVPQLQMPDAFLEAIGGFLG
jgi:3-oxoadipate enol-lactonase